MTKGRIRCSGVTEQSYGRKSAACSHDGCDWSVACMAPCIGTSANGAAASTCMARLPVSDHIDDGPPRLPPISCMSVYRMSLWRQGDGGASLKPRHSEHPVCNLDSATGSPCSRLIDFPEDPVVRYAGRPPLPAPADEANGCNSRLLNNALCRICALWLFSSRFSETSQTSDMALTQGTDTGDTYGTVADTDQNREIRIRVRDAARRSRAHEGSTVSLFAGHVSRDPIGAAGRSPPPMTCVGPGLSPQPTSPWRRAVRLTSTVSALAPCPCRADPCFPQCPHTVTITGTETWAYHSAVRCPCCQRPAAQPNRARVVACAPKAHHGLAVTLITSSSSFVDVARLGPLPDLKIHLQSPMQNVQCLCERHSEAFLQPVCLARCYLSFFLPLPSLSIHNCLDPQLFRLVKFQGRCLTMNISNDPRQQRDLRSRLQPRLLEPDPPVKRLFGDYEKTKWVVLFARTRAVGDRL
ncbi:hypothetical protein VTN00DRAFT_8974 [Thermoascus crustaceus]|uniref:uncharacterized protein n=1 Tax=Thermoascus crustaceus TaxID=5088 RepID=UPI003742AAB4